MSLFPEATYGLVKEHTVVVLGVHLHQALHEVLLISGGLLDW
jgi:hypothetical protein